MVYVYVWEPSSNGLGHVSMKVTEGSPVGVIYISWWPVNGGSGFHVFYDIAERPRTFDMDCDDETRSPEHIIDIPGMNETRIKEWWRKWRRGEFHWGLLTYPCTQVVYNALRVAGGEVSFGEFVTWNVLWTPMDIFRYSLYLKRRCTGQLR